MLRTPTLAHSQAEPFGNMVHAVSVVHPGDGRADWELWLAAAAQHHKRILYYCVLGLHHGGKVEKL